MKKLIRGIVNFRRNVQETYRQAWGRLALGQSPDTLFIACSDSRVVPQKFASTDPGDLFVVRNVGNLVPPCAPHDATCGDDAEAAAIELSVVTLGVTDIIVCGHSECAAMRALIDDRARVELPNLRGWLRHGDGALARLRAEGPLDASLPPHDQLSQLNVLQQMVHVQSHPAVARRVAEGRLAVHGWWFDLARADVYAFEPQQGRFVVLDEAVAAALLARLEK